MKSAVLIYIRQDDGAQQYRTGPGILDVVWLMGIARHQDAKVGDTGSIYYDRAINMYRFRKDER